MGDATSYSMFMCTWSEKYQGLLEDLPSPADDEPQAALKLPKGVFRMATPATPTKPRQGLVPGRFGFKQEDLQALKAKVFPPPGAAAAAAAECTTNDILMAEFACAVAPFRLAALREAAGRGWHAQVHDPIHQPVQILVLADRRGRGIDQDSFGNHNADLSIRLSFQLLLSGDIAAVARGEVVVDCVRWISVAYGGEIHARVLAHAARSQGESAHHRGMQGGCA